MSIKVVLFDLDGTLLPMDQDLFVEQYFKLLAARMAHRGYEPKQLIRAIWAGTEGMIKNDGKKSNEAVFWDIFAGIFGEESRGEEPYLEEFYKTDFQKVQEICAAEPLAAEVIRRLKAAGLRRVLATNPIFPSVATESRIRWAGLNAEDFELFTTYENAHFSKPNPAYYREILDRLEVSPEECLMVGNDVGDDMVAETLGMKVFLLTDHLINKENVDISRYPNGDFNRLLEYLEPMMKGNL